jgi:hypothetical protein
MWWISMKSGLSERSSEFVARRFHVETGPYPEAADMVHTITRLTIASGAEVRWYDYFICHSIILADTNRRRGWVHIESVFPWSTTDQRPSYTIYRRTSPKPVAEMQRIFDTLWEHSVRQQPPDSSGQSPKA